MKTVQDATTSNEDRLDSLKITGPEATKNMALEIDAKLKGFDKTASQKLREAENNIQKNGQDIASHSNLLQEHTENINTLISTNNTPTNQEQEQKMVEQSSNDLNQIRHQTQDIENQNGISNQEISELDNDSQALLEDKTEGLDKTNDNLLSKINDLQTDNAQSLVDFRQDLNNKLAQHDKNWQVEHDSIRNETHILNQHLEEVKSVHVSIEKRIVEMDTTNKQLLEKLLGVVKDLDGKLQSVDNDTKKHESGFPLTRPSWTQQTSSANTGWSSIMYWVIICVTLLAGLGYMATLKNHTGFPHQAIPKYICADYKADAAKAAVQVRMALKRGAAKGVLKMARASGKESASYKVVRVKKPAAKKPAAKKPTKKAANKLPPKKKQSASTIPTIKSTPRPHDREKIPSQKQSRAPSYTLDDDIQEVVPDKSEPCDPIFPTDHHQPAATHALVQAGTQHMDMAYQEENYENYGQYKAEQEYGDSCNMETHNKGSNIKKMGSEKFCLRWNDFKSNISSAFRELRDDKDFFDITLACDDEQIQAHKVILRACSPFSWNLMRRKPHQHPLLYPKGVKFTDLQSVLNFMYHGEVNVAQEELNSFQDVAEDLKVKGLTQNQSQSEPPKRESQQQPPELLPNFKILTLFYF